MSAEKREEWEIELNEPLPNSRPDRPTERQAEEEGAMFMTAMSVLKRG